jgi:hypothetical protein
LLISSKVGDCSLARLNDIRQNTEVFQDDLKYTLIPGPFYADISNHPDVPKVRRIWKMFKENVNYAPTEVMVLGIYNALRDRFGESLACIGWRSGSLDGAGFLGIPIFFFDDVIINNYRKLHLQKLSRVEPDQRSYLAASKALHDWTSKYGDGGYLFNPPAPSNDYEQERMEEAAFYIDTFIIIVVQRLWGAKDVIETNEKSFERLPTLAHDVDGGLEKTDDVLKLGLQARRHLAVALFLWCCSSGTEDHRPNWTNRIGLMSVTSEEVRQQWLEYIKTLFGQLDEAGYVESHVVRPNKRVNEGYPDPHGGEPIGEDDDV